MSVTVRVALRVRPFNEKEKKDDNLITFIPEEEQQIKIIDGDRRHNFTFDHVYPPNISQADVYHSCIKPLFDQFTKGYNATVLAYGQTGSGKTYSMGTSGDLSQEQNHGIVPRFTENLFQWISSIHKEQNVKYQVKVSFLELYHEDIIDLLNVSTSSQINIREDVSGNITWSGVHEQIVENAVDLLNCLYQGSLNRTTGSTDMNSNSSRSHAIFSVTLIQQQLPESMITNSKFHFVDLAGSERLKRTNASGDRAKEGISINAGLLALGNVISALGDEKKKKTTSHVPYRNSKLTRLLQDSLGGNSQTLMLACVSPADSNANETLSTLKYANRAKNITNRVVLNQQLSEVDTMKQEIARLRHELKINDAFIKEVHVELDDLRAKNLALSSNLFNDGMPNADVNDNDETANNHKKLVLVARSQKKQQQQTKLPTTIHQEKRNLSTSNHVEDDDDVVTLVGSASISEDIKTHRSTSTRRKRKHSKKSNANNNSSTTTDNPSITHNNKDIVFSLDKHKNRTRKESLFIKQIKANNNASSDPALFTKMMNLFQSSIREQKQLIQRIEQQQLPQQEIQHQNSPPVITNNQSATTEKRISVPPLLVIPKKNPVKPSLIRQPNTINSTNNNKTEETTHRMTLVVEENKGNSNQLKQIAIQVKKALSILSATEDPLTLQLKPIFQKITSICNTKSSKSFTTTTTKSSETIIKKRLSTTTNNKRANIAETHREIQRIIAFDKLKSNTVCTEICKSLKEKKLKLVREQKDLLKERKSMLKEFYHHEYAEEQQKQQYMDERIDCITVEVDFIAEQLKLLHPSISSPLKIEKCLIDLLKPLKEQDLRSLLFMIVQQDLINYHVTIQLHHLTTRVLEKYQQSIVQLRRDNDISGSDGNYVMNTQVIKDLLKSSPIKCLSNGLILLSSVKS